MSQSTTAAAAAGGGKTTSNHDAKAQLTPSSKSAATTSVLIASADSPLDSGLASGQASNTGGNTATTTQYYANGSGLGGAGISGATGKDKKKIGHREVKDGIVHYKKVSTDELKKSIQFGMVHFINEQNRANSKYNIDRDLLMQDFQMVETIVFPRAGSASTPAHSFNDFKLKVYAPYGFKYLRKKFNVNEVDFMHALGETDLKEISNPGASGSVFYKTSNDKYILKTVQNKESEFLMTLLAGYALNLLQNLINGKYTLLPTIYGLFCYQKLELASLLSDKTNIRIVIMNNILPSDLPIHEKYDLKGSTYKRKASTKERSKSSPTYKDLDFLEIHPDGIILDERHYDNIISSLKRDCLILESFGIMDYSMLLGIHNLEKEKNNNAIEAYYEAKIVDPPPQTTVEAANSQTSPIILNQNRFSSRNLENVFNISAVPARSAKGERLLLYFGIIDILQNYRLKKRAEHTLKSMITDGRQISVCPPNFYSKRFIEFMTTKVFKKATLKSSPARKRTLTFRADSNLRKNDEATTPSQPGPSTSGARYSQVSTASNASQQSEAESSPPPPVPPSSAIPVSNSTRQLTDAAVNRSQQQQQRQQQYAQQPADYKQSFKNIRAIDSVDSVSAILASTDNANKSNINNNNSTSKYGDYGVGGKSYTLMNRTDANSSRTRQPNQSSFNSSKFNAIEDAADNEFLKIDSYKSDNEIENRRTPITPIIHHYKTLDNKVNFIRANLDMTTNNSSDGAMAKSLSNSRRDIPITTATTATTTAHDPSAYGGGLSTNGITLKIQTPSSSYYNTTYSNKSLSSANRHDSSVLLTSNNETNDAYSLSSSPWNQSPTLKQHQQQQHHDSNPAKFNGQKSSSQQYITKIQINGPGNVSSGRGGGDKSFLSYQDARSHTEYQRSASPASLQYSLTPISSRAAPNKAGGRGANNVQYNEIELVPTEFSVKHNLTNKNNAIFHHHSNGLQQQPSTAAARSHSTKENTARQYVPAHVLSSPPAAAPLPYHNNRVGVNSSLSISHRATSNSVAAVLDRLNDGDDDEEEESIRRDFELSSDPLVSGPKYVQKQILQRKFSFYVIDTIVPLSRTETTTTSSSAALSTSNLDQEQHFVQYSVQSSNTNYFDHHPDLTTRNNH